MRASVKVYDNEEKNLSEKHDENTVHSLNWRYNSNTEDDDDEKDDETALSKGLHKKPAQLIHSINILIIEILNLQKSTVVLPPEIIISYG